MNCRPEPDALAYAASDIFELNYSMSAVLGRLIAARQRLGMLSNTCDMHWQYISTGRYWFVPNEFEAIVLSYRVQLMKPDPQIFLHAAELAGVRPEEVFYVDDMPQHVAGARAAGFDAVQYTTTPAFVAELAKARRAVCVLDSILGKQRAEGASLPAGSSRAQCGCSANNCPLPLAARHRPLSSAPVHAESRIFMFGQISASCCSM